MRNQRRFTLRLPEPRAAGGSCCLLAVPRVTTAKLKTRRQAGVLLLLGWLLVGGLDLYRAGLLPAVAWAAEGRGLFAQVQVEKEAVAVGEPFLLQVRVEGSDLPPGTAPPDLSGIVDFAVEYLGGQSNNSSSVTIVNGKMSKIESFGYVYSYRLTPKKVGDCEIPSLTVPLEAGKAQALHTKPVRIRVSEPERTDDFHLELKFSKTNCYVGEPLVLTVVWYLAKDVESVTFNIPILRNEAFTVIDPKVDQEPRKQYFQLPIGATNVLAEKGSGFYRGREYTTLSFRRILIARQAGTHEMPEAIVSCKALVGYSGRQPRRGPFDDFFDDDFFRPGRKAVYKTFVARSAPLALTVMALPEEGRPANFAGWVGHFQVESSATPTEVSIGDPVTLTLSVSGSEYLDTIELPPLTKDLEIERNFKVPEEMAAGVIRGGVKQFTQTLRPKNAEVKAIPPIKIPYFNPDAGRYEIAQSRPIALTVKATRVLTSADVEGKPGDAAHRKSELETWSQGIAHNYEGPEVLERQIFRISTVVRSSVWLGVMVLPFLAFLSLLVITKFRRRQAANPDRLRARKAFARFRQRVNAIGTEGSEGSYACAALLDAIRGYLEEKLRLNGPALTFADIEGDLTQRKIEAQLAERLRGLFTACEQNSYGGMSLHAPFEELVKEAGEVIRALDRATSKK